MGISRGPARRRCWRTMRPAGACLIAMLVLLTSASRAVAIERQRAADCAGVRPAAALRSVPARRSSGPRAVLAADLSISDWAAVATAALTALGLGFALFQFRDAVAGRANLHVGVGDVLRVHFVESFRLVITLDLIVINQGAQAGALTDVLGELRNAQGKATCKLRWERFERTQLTGGHGQKQPVTGSVDVVSTLMVPGRSTGEGITRRVRLYELPGSNRAGASTAKTAGDALRTAAELTLTLTESSGAGRQSKRSFQVADHR